MDAAAMDDFDGPCQLGEAGRFGDVAVRPGGEAGEDAVAVLARCQRHDAEGGEPCPDGLQAGGSRLAQQLEIEQQQGLRVGREQGHRLLEACGGVDRPMRPGGEQPDEAISHQRPGLGHHDPGAHQRVTWAVPVGQRPAAILR